MSALRLTRCGQCFEAGAAWCPHNGVLLVFVDGVPVYVRGRNEEAARLTADRMRIHWKGAPFHPPRKLECVA